MEASKKTVRAINRDRINTLKSSEITLFCTQVSLFLRAGVSLVEGLALLCEDIDNPVFQAVLVSVSHAVENRKSFADAVRQTGAFPSYMVRMVGIGEMSGNLDGVLQALADFYERESQIKQRVRSSVTYPLVLIVMMSAIVLLLVVQVLPMFDDLLRSLGGEMPPMVRGLMSFGHFMGRYWWSLALIVLICFLVPRLLRKMPRGRRSLDQFKTKFFLTRSLTKKIAAERFSSAMAFLLRSSVDLEISLELTGELLDNSYMQGKIDECRRRVSQGEDVPDAFYQAGIFPRLFTRMLAVGFKTGDLDGMVSRLSDMYEQEVNTSLSRIIGAIEPAFIAMLSVVVGIILISVMLPLIRIMATIG